MLVITTFSRFFFLFGWSSLNSVNNLRDLDICFDKKLNMLPLFDPCWTCLFIIITSMFRIGLHVSNRIFLLSDRLFAWPKNKGGTWWLPCVDEQLFYRNLFVSKMRSSALRPISRLRHCRTFFNMRPLALTSTIVDEPLTPCSSPIGKQSYRRGGQGHAILEASRWPNETGLLFVKWSALAFESNCHICFHVLLR